MNYMEYLGLLAPRKLSNAEVQSIVNTQKGQANGLASLDNNGKVTSSQLPCTAAAPSTDGTYFYTCTVTSGTPVYSWESLEDADGH